MPSGCRHVSNLPNAIGSRSAMGAAQKSCHRCRTLAAVAVVRDEGQRLGSDAITSPASASSRQGVTVNGSRSAHWAVQRYIAFGSVDSEIANPLPSMPCQRPNILTPSGGAPPVSRKRAAAALKVRYIPTTDELHVSLPCLQ